MRGLQTEFFADTADMSALLDCVHESGEFRFTAMSGVVNCELIGFSNPLELLKYVVVPEQPERRAGFMITLPQTEVISRRIKMADGSGVKLTLDASSNLDSARIALGGDAGEHTLIASVVDSGGETASARALHAHFKKIVVKKSRRISGHLVMPGALEKLHSGWRLTAGKSHHRGLDVPRPLD